MTDDKPKRIDLILAIDGEVVVEQHLEAQSFTYEASNIPYLTDDFGSREIASPPPDRAFTLDVYGAKRVDPPTGWGEDAFSLTALFGRFPSQISVLLARWYPDKGWLVTRRGIVRHGIIEPMRLEDQVVLEAKSGLRAMEHRAKTDGLEW